MSSFYDNHAEVLLTDRECDVLYALVERRLQQIEADPSPTLAMRDERKELGTIGMKLTQPRHYVRDNKRSQGADNV